MEEEWVIGVAKDMKPPEKENPNYLAIFPANTKEGEFGPMICMVSDLSSVNDGDVAHAKLIVAAPKLLAACEEFVRKCECGEARSKRSYAQMKEAITKAKGI
jgi:hypothetical protein